MANEQRPIKFLIENHILRIADAEQVKASSVHMRPVPTEEVPCPAELVLPTSKKQLLSKSQHCMATYMALLASQAVYESSPENYLATQTKTFARLL